MALGYTSYSKLKVGGGVCACLIPGREQPEHQTSRRLAHPSPFAPPVATITWANQLVTWGSLLVQENPGYPASPWGPKCLGALMPRPLGWFLQLWAGLCLLWVPLHT